MPNKNKNQPAMWWLSVKVVIDGYTQEEVTAHLLDAVSTLALRNDPQVIVEAVRPQEDPS